MATSLIDDLSGLFRSQVLGEASADLHESETSVMRGFQTSSAAILGGLAAKSGETGFMRQAHDLITGSYGDGRALDGLGSLFKVRSASGVDDAPSGRLLSMLFGRDQTRIAEGISQSSGLRSDSASKLLSFAAPVVLGLLGKRVRDEHLDANGLSNLLRQERPRISGLLPASLSNLLPATASAASAGSSYVASSAPQTASSNRWVWPVVALLALAGLFWIWSRSRTNLEGVAERSVDATRNGAERVANGARETAADATGYVRQKLGDGAELNIPSTGMEARLLDYLRTPGQTVDPNRWFDFDRLTFDTGSATLRPDSQEQLRNIAAILKANPEVNVKIGGYTDNTGDPAANLRLSQQRADTVRQQLVNLGIAANRVEAEGYGGQFPVADNSTEEGRAKNRRIALRVTEL